MDSDKIVVYQDLEDIYVLCMRQVISSVCEKAWSGTDDGAFGTFKKYDNENTKSTNEQTDSNFEKAKEKYKNDLKEYEENKDKNIKKPKKPDPANFKHISAITAKAKSFKKFDFQACNNTLAHLEPVYNKIFEQYKFNDSQIEICKKTALELVRLRNKLAHRDPEDPPSKIVEYQKGCIDGIRTMLNLGFGTTTDKNDILFSDSFKVKYSKYVDQELQRWYPLSDFLDLELYDASRFLDACATNKITATKKDAKYFFRTSNLEKTVEILKNNLALNGDLVTPNKSVSSETIPQTISSTQPKPPKSNKLIYIILSIVIAVILGGAILIAAIVPAIIHLINGVKETPKTPTYSSQSSVVDNSSESLDNDSQTSNLSSYTTQNNGQNQILPEHENEIKALQHSDKLALSNSTLYVDVGGYVTPPPATVWSDIKIYSQDTSIAVGEDLLVKGVSPGTTYIIVESRLGISSAFRVIVE